MIALLSIIALLFLLSLFVDKHTRKNIGIIIVLLLAVSVAMFIKAIAQ